MAGVYIHPLNCKAERKRNIPFIGQPQPSDIIFAKSIINIYKFQTHETAIHVQKQQARRQFKPFTPLTTLLRIRHSATLNGRLKPQPRNAHTPNVHTSPRTCHGSHEATRVPALQLSSNPYLGHHQRHHHHHFKTWKLKQGHNNNEKETTPI